MIPGGLAQFREKRVLLLQGPVGPFFRRLTEDLTWAGARVCKINFNGGDWLFHPQNSTLFRESMQEWPAFLAAFILEREIDIVILFGDCRPIHNAARVVAEKLGIDIAVFEEGYVRPDYVTFERNGVNAHSSISRSPVFYLNAPKETPHNPQMVRHPFWMAVLWASLYYLASHLLKPFFPNYKHHRPLHIWESLYWFRSFFRFWLYKFQERHFTPLLSGPLSGKYYLVALQVHVDSQILTHSNYNSIAYFIKEILSSFAAHSEPDHLIVLKHHPLDRGYHDYTKLIREVTQKLGIQNRVLYIHDQPMPLLLDNARGVVVINSTVGLSAIHHQKPTKVCGEAVYDILGLTFQGPLDAFWKPDAQKRPDPFLYHQFRNHLIRNTQLNGNFYRRLNIPGFATGLVWTNQDFPVDIKQILIPITPVDLSQVS